MKTIPYYTAVIRYIPDIVSGECMNVGVIVYAPTAAFFDYKFENQTQILSEVFGDFSTSHHRKYIRTLKENFSVVKARVASTKHELDFPLPDFKSLLESILPYDDVSYRVEYVGGGLSTEETLPTKLSQEFSRFIGNHKNNKKKEDPEKNIWSKFSDIFSQKELLTHFTPKTIEISNGITLEFEHCWQNGKANIIQPIFLGYKEQKRIESSIWQWSGKVNELYKQKDNVEINFLVALSDDNNLANRTKKILDLLSVYENTNIYHEDDYEDFAKSFEERMQEH